PHAPRDLTRRSCPRLDWGRGRHSAVQWAARAHEGIGPRGPKTGSVRRRLLVIGIGALALTGVAAGSSGPPVDVGRTVLLGPRTKTGGCTLGANPDRRCSPGAYSSGLTSQLLCSPSFRTSSIRHVPQSLKFAVEQEYGL